MVGRLLLIVAVAIASVSAHGVITSPTPRAPGAALESVCGSGPTQVLSSDLTAPIENAVKKVADDTTSDCALFLCRGLRLEDNLENIQTFPAGSTVPITINLRVKHIGPANVSIINTQTQTLIGEPLFNWPVYADPANPHPNETAFSVTVPDLGGQCADVGVCALQWWWFGDLVSQTYESCIDFVQ